MICHQITLIYYMYTLGLQLYDTAFFVYISVILILNCGIAVFSKLTG